VRIGLKIFSVNTIVKAFFQEFSQMANIFGHKRPARPPSFWYDVLEGPTGASPIAERFAAISTEKLVEEVLRPTDSQPVSSA
jgi:hypothetical protein